MTDDLKRQIRNALAEGVRYGREHGLGYEELFDSVLTPAVVRLIEEENTQAHAVIDAWEATTAEWKRAAMRVAAQRDALHTELGKRCGWGVPDAVLKKLSES